MVAAGDAEAARLLTAHKPKLADLISWLKEYRDLAVADHIYRLAVANSTRTIRRHHKTIKVAVVTNIPAPVSVGRRSGGYEVQELPEPTLSSEAARAIFAPVLADIKAGTPGCRNAAACRLFRPPIPRRPRMSPSCRIALPLPIWPKAWINRPSSLPHPLPTPRPVRSWNGMRDLPPIAWGGGAMPARIWKSWQGYWQA